MERLFPSDVFAAEATRARAGDARPHVFAAAAASASESASAAASAAAPESAPSCRTATPCERCGAALGDHDLAVRWRHRPGRGPAAVEDVLALLEASRKLVGTEKSRKWLDEVRKSCWRSTPRLAALGIPDDKIREAARALETHATERDAVAVVVQKLDEAYFSTFYEARTRRIRLDRQRWSPCAFFERVEHKWLAEPKTSEQGARDQDVMNEPELYRLWHARIQEHRRWGKALVDVDATLRKRRRVPETDWAGRGRPPLQSAPAQAWFDNLRDWPAHLYAYAVPTREALREIAKLGSIIEVGAGTGYWAHLLRKIAGADLVAADIAPLSHDDGEGGTMGKRKGGRKGSGQPRARANEYHGRLPAYTRIEGMAKGPQGPCMEATWAQRDALFLCYPPPGSPMAERALGQFEGQFVAIVGEWIGTTATQAFEVALQRSFVLYKRLPLPNWPNTAYTLTLWRRRKEAVAQQTPVALQAVTCAVCAGALGEVQELRRCALTRAITFCSLRCFSRGKEAWDNELSIRGIPRPAVSAEDAFGTVFDALMWPYKVVCTEAMQTQRAKCFQNFTASHEQKSKPSECPKAQEQKQEHKLIARKDVVPRTGSTQQRPTTSKPSQGSSRKRPILLLEVESKKRRPKQKMKKRKSAPRHERKKS